MIAIARQENLEGQGDVEFVNTRLEDMQPARRGRLPGGVLSVRDPLGRS